MIRNEAEYQEALRRLKDEEERHSAQHMSLRAMNLSDEEIKRVMDPLASFHLQLVEEVESYERFKRGDLGEVVNLHGLGRILVALRIARGISQRELAIKLEVHESQVSRDERNEYHGVTVERASKILDILGAELQSHFTAPIQKWPVSRAVKQAVG